MTKIFAGFLGLALLAAPFPGFAAEVGTPAPLRPAGPENRASYCGSHSDGAMYTGTVTGIAADWFGDAGLPFTVTDTSGNRYVEVSNYKYTSPEAGSMFAVITAAYISKSPIIIYCFHGQYAGSLYLNQYP